VRIGRGQNGGRRACFAVPAPGRWLLTLVVYVLGGRRSTFLSVDAPEGPDGGWDLLYPWRKWAIRRLSPKGKRSSRGQGE